MKKIAIIPARSGSKGLKDKNIIDLCGKPMMAYSIEAAVKSGVFERVIVSTDAEEYKNIALEYGAEVIMRGETLSNDTATSYMVIEDILNKVSDECYDYFVLLQPTSPLRNHKHIVEAVQSFENSYDRFDFLVSVKEAEHANVLVKRIEEDCSLKHFDTDFSNYRRQTYKEYSPNGAIFMGKIPNYISRKHFFGSRSMAYIMNKYDSVDIDDELDYKFAKVIMEENCET